jgi:PadR family transcriptional regulator PadR
LNMLARKDMYGYELIKELHLKSEGVFDLKEGTLYPILHALELEKNVEAYWQEEGSRPRKYYRITKAGRALLKDKKKQWNEFRKAITSVLGERCVLE